MSSFPNVKTTFSSRGGVPPTITAVNITPYFHSAAGADPNIHTVLITDPLSCAVCKFRICLGSLAHRLPCSHIYHSKCMLSWFSNHSSCLHCRSYVPSVTKDNRNKPRIEEDDSHITLSLAPPMVDDNDQLTRLSLGGPWNSS